jgi:hypothetical protein
MYVRLTGNTCLPPPHMYILFLSKFSVLYRENLMLKALRRIWLYPGDHKEMSLSLLTNSALVYEPKYGGGGMAGLSQ